MPGIGGGWGGLDLHRTIINGRYKTDGIRGGIRLSRIGDPNEGNQMHRRAKRKKGSVYKRKGYQRRTNYISTHFAAMSDHWENEGESLITITSTITEEFGSISQGANICYSETQSKKGILSGRNYLWGGGMQRRRESYDAVSYPHMRCLAYSHYRM